MVLAGHRVLAVTKHAGSYPELNHLIADGLTLSAPTPRSLLEPMKLDTVVPQWCPITSIDYCWLT